MGKDDYTLKTLIEIARANKVKYSNIRKPELYNTLNSLGLLAGSPKGSPKGSLKGSPKGSAKGSPKGSPKGSAKGAKESPKTKKIKLKKGECLPPKYQWIVGKGCFEAQGVPMPVPMPLPMPVPIPPQVAEFPTDAKIAKMKKDDIRDFINTMYSLVMQPPPSMPASLKKDALVAIAITARDRTKASLGSPPRPIGSPQVPRPIASPQIRRAMTEGDIARLIHSIGTQFSSVDQGDFVLASAREDIGAGLITTVAELKDSIVKYKEAYAAQTLINPRAQSISPTMSLADLNTLVVQIQSSDENLEIESDAQGVYVSNNLERDVRSGRITDMPSLEAALRFYLNEYLRAQQSIPIPTRTVPTPPLAQRPIEDQLGDIQAPNVQSAEYRENIARIQKCLGLI